MDTNGVNCDESKFDYASVSVSVAKFLQGQAKRIRHGRTTSIIQAGNGLIEAKQHLSHGAFIRWVSAEVGIPIRTAQAYMQVAQWAEGKSALVAHLPPSILYLLSSPSAPEEFIVKYLKSLEGGQCVDLRTARAELKSMRRAKRNTKPVSAVAAEEDVEPPIELERGPTMMEAIVILARELSAADFARFRHIMTSRAVLDDRNLPQKIAAAFSLAESAGSRRQAQRAPIAA